VTVPIDAEVRSQTAGLIALLLLAATAVGLVLSLLLLGTTGTYGGPLGGEWWFPLFAATAVVLGWVSSRVLGWPLSLVVAAVVGPMAVGTVLLVKILRWPEWSAVTPSNSLPWLLVIWSVVAVAAALIPTKPPQGLRIVRGLFIGTVLGSEIVGATLFAFVLGLFIGT
jgi:hypothetical protein